MGIWIIFVENGKITSILINKACIYKNYSKKQYLTSYLIYLEPTISGDIHEKTININLRCFAVGV